MNEVLLLQGPDGNRYKATEISTDIWNVAPFLNFHQSFISDWWKHQSEFDSQYGKRNTNYKTTQLKETFSILAKTETYPSNFIIHDAH
tara:strand:+ start:454 stop:717 length:264 start_codon:yes stop_codon:yes gene_type:complete